MVRRVELPKTGLSGQRRAEGTQLQVELTDEHAVHDVEKMSAWHTAGDRMGIGQETPHVLDGSPNLESSMQTDGHAVSWRFGQHDRTGANLARAVGGRQVDVPRIAATP